MKQPATYVFAIILAWISVGCAQPGEVADTVYTNGRIDTESLSKEEVLDVLREYVEGDPLLEQLLGKRLSTITTTTIIAQD